MDTRRTLYIPGFAALVLGAAACGGAAAPSTELLTARQAYDEARNGEAARLNPTGVHQAAKAMQAAEAAHKDDAGSQREKNYAYIALRRSEIAIAGASEALAKQEQQRADQTYQAQLEQQSQRAEQQRSRYAQQLNQTEVQLQQNAQALQQRQQELQQARAEAEKAQAELRNADALREEAGRMIISLSGVLFESGGDSLSQLAERRLDTVVQALAAYPDRPILVEGYTDSQGSEEKNQQLSQRRAEAVREYLQQRGIDPARLRAVGKGEANPVASNDTAEGRANNRRVEIVVERVSESRSSSTSDSSSASDRAVGSPAAPGTDVDRTTMR
ncbi:MAG TPA: OmpA family protein [Polyangiaceae bacterium]|nr:OmpA family protein [Polyangiaceae bacterium]